MPPARGTRPVLIRKFAAAITRVATASRSRRYLHARTNRSTAMASARMSTDVLMPADRPERPRHPGGCEQQSTRNHRDPRGPLHQTIVGGGPVTVVGESVEFPANLTEDAAQVHPQHAESRINALSEGAAGCVHRRPTPINVEDDRPRKSRWACAGYDGRQESVMILMIEITRDRTAGPEMTGGVGTRRNPWLGIDSPRDRRRWR